MNRSPSLLPDLPTAAKRCTRRGRVSAYVLGALLIGCTAPALDSETAGSNLEGKGTKTTEPTEPTEPGTTEPGTKPTEPGVPEPTVIPDLPDEWPLNGSSDCVNHTNAEPNIFIHKYDENTYILRENKCLNFEANFIYLLFGHDKVLMQDTGSIPRDWATAAGIAKFTAAFPIRNTVEGLIAEWLGAHPNPDGTPRTRDSMELLVTHSHSHGDHVGGDYQFKQADGTPFPHTQIAGLRPTQVASFFGITEWPAKPATLDLGNRKLDVLGIPGHEASHVAIYDHGAKLLLSGDSLYPGHIFVNSWTEFRSSMARLKTFVHEAGPDGKPARPITYVLGTHIEKKPEAFKFYPYPSWIHDPERHLELDLGHVDLLIAEMQRLGPTSPHREIPYADFAIDAQ